MTAVLLALLLTSCLAYEGVNVNVTQPQTNAPLNTTLAYYKLAGFNGDDDYLTHGFYETSCGSNLSFHYTEPSVWGNDTGTRSKPILILTHGYPESSYIWRRLTSVLSSRLPIIVPDQPGYGDSSPCCNETGCAYDKRTYSHAIFEAVKHVYPGHGENETTSVVLAGHDRGGRTMHRAAVDNNFPGIDAMGLFVADIVPIVAEYAAFSNPNASIGYFHWSFLPKGEFATDVIMAYGGGNWVDQILEYGSGESVQGIELFKADNAWQVYHTFFDQLTVTNSSVFDYQAGGTIEYDEMVADQKNDHKVDIPTHVLFSEANLGAQFDVMAVWSEYVHASAGLTIQGIGEQKGHFIIEEAPDETIAQINAFLDRLGVDY